MITQWGAGVGGSMSLKNDNKLVVAPGIQIWDTLKAGTWDAGFLLIGAAVGVFSIQKIVGK